MADIVVMLLDPLAEQRLAEAAGDPGVAERMHCRVPLRDRLFQSLTESRCRHDLLLVGPRRGCCWAGIVYNLWPAGKRERVVNGIIMGPAAYTEGDQFQRERRRLFAKTWLL